MTRKQAVFIIILNAIISAAISVGVALLLIPPAQRPSVTTQPVEVIPGQATAAPQDGTAAQAAEPNAPAVASAGPTGPAGVAPTSTSIVYVVQAGDTISSLALQFDVPAADIMAVNQLQNPDFLQAGVELIIPIGGLSPATATRTTGTPIPFEPPSTGLTATASVEPNEPASSPPTSSGTTAATAGELVVEISEIVGVGEIELERVAITNVGDSVADMEGWTLSDAEGNIYVFPNYRLWPGGNVTVHTRTGQDGNPLSSLFWGKLQAVWSSGVVATLKSAEGRVITTYAVGP
jgi:LysM repeat protein